MNKKTIAKVIIFVLIVIACLFVWHKTHAAAAEKKSTKSLEALKKAKAYIESIKNAKPDIKIENVKLVLDVDGRVFMKDTAEATIKLQDLVYKGAVKFDANVYVVPKVKKEKIYTGLGLMYAAMADVKNKEKLDKGELFATYRMASIKSWSAEAVANTKRYGLGLGKKVTNNSKVIAGAVWKYGEKVERKNALAFVGFGFEF